MPRLLIAVECDFWGYEPFSARQCRYSHRESLECVARSLDLVLDECGGRAAFLIHTSPYVRRYAGDPFYALPEYLSMWQRAVHNGAELGLHLHEEEPDGSCMYYGYSRHLESVVSEHVRMLAERGLVPTCEATGYHGLNEWVLPVLEANGLLVNLDNIGRMSPYTCRNWTDAPLRPYFPDQRNVLVEGDSRVLVVPLAMTDYCRGDDGMMANRNSLRYLRSVWRAVESASQPDDVYFLWIEAEHMCRDGKKLKALLRFLRSRDVEFVVPSDIYREYAAGHTRRAVSCEY